MDVIACDHRGAWRLRSRFERPTQVSRQSLYSWPMLAVNRAETEADTIVTYTRFALDIPTPSLWRVTFDHPPINLIDAVMIRELEAGVLRQAWMEQAPTELDTLTLLAAADADTFVPLERRLCRPMRAVRGPRHSTPWPACSRSTSA